MNFRYEVVINRSRDDVWKLFDNPDNMKKRKWRKAGSW